MKTLTFERATLADCVEKAQTEHVVVTRRGKPVALVVSTEGLDAEQVELGANPKFWKLISQRRKSGTITREELEAALARQD